MRLTDKQRLAALSEAELQGFGGNCGEVAIAINEILFDGKGQLVAAVNSYLWHKKKRFVGHVGVKVKGSIWDAEGAFDGPGGEEEFLAWGSLDPEDSDYEFQKEDQAFDAEIVGLTKEKTRGVLPFCGSVNPHNALRVALEHVTGKKLKAASNPLFEKWRRRGENTEVTEEEVGIDCPSCGVEMQRTRGSAIACPECGYQEERATPHGYVKSSSVSAKYMSQDSAMCKECGQNLSPTMLSKNKNHLYSIGILYECPRPCGKSKLWTNSVRNEAKLLAFLEGKAADYTNGFCNDKFDGFLGNEITVLKNGVDVPGTDQRADLYGNKSIEVFYWKDLEDQPSADTTNKVIDFYRKNVEGLRHAMGLGKVESASTEPVVDIYVHYDGELGTGEEVVASVNDEPIGHVSVFSDRDAVNEYAATMGVTFSGLPEGRIGYIGGVELPRALRGKGIGEKAFSLLVEKAQQRSVKALALVSEIPALGFWSKMGFKTGHTDSVLPTMVKLLSKPITPVKASIIKSMAFKKPYDGWTDLTPGRLDAPLELEKAPKLWATIADRIGHDVTKGLEMRAPIIGGKRRYHQRPLRSYHTSNNRTLTLTTDGLEAKVWNNLKSKRHPAMPRIYDVFSVKKKGDKESELWAIVHEPLVWPVHDDWVLFVDTFFRWRAMAKRALTPAKAEDLEAFLRFVIDPENTDQETVKRQRIEHVLPWKMTRERRDDVSGRRRKLFRVKGLEDMLQWAKSALQYLKANKVRFRDFDPSNIAMTKQGNRVVITNLAESRSKPQRTGHTGRVQGSAIPK